MLHLRELANYSQFLWVVIGVWSRCYQGLIGHIWFPKKVKPRNTHGPREESSIDIDLFATNTYFLIDYVKFDWKKNACCFSC